MKKTIAKHADVIVPVVMFVALMVLFTESFGDQWDVPPAFLEAIFLFVGLCGWCLLAFFVAAMTARQFNRAIWLGVFCSVYVEAFYQLLWIPFASLRLWMLILLLASVCFSALLAYYKSFPGRGALQKAIIIFAALMGLPMGAMAVLFHFMTPLDVVKQTVTSPDGRYQAVRIDRNDTDSTEYEVVTIKSNYFSVLNILDYPQREIIQLTDSESLAGVRWAGPRTLVVGYYSGIIFAQQDKSWRNVTIVYKNEPSR